MEQNYYPKIFYGYVIIGATSVIMIMLWGTYYSFGVFFKPMLDEFCWSRGAISSAFSLSSVIMGLTGIVVGYMNDRHGPRLVMSMSGICLGVGYIMMSMIHSPWHLYLVYGFIVGTGMGGGFVPLMSTVARWFGKKIGIMTGLLAAAIGVGAVVGPPLAHYLIYIYGWRVSYIILGTIALIVIVVAAQLLKHETPEGNKCTEEPTQCCVAMKSGPQLEGFLRREALRRMPFWLYFAAIICFGYSVFSVIIHVVSHAIELGFSPAEAARILATIGFFSIIGKLLFGKLLDIFGSRNIFIVGLILMSVALMLLVGARAIWTFYLFAALFGVAYGGGVATESPLVAFLFGLKAHGAILGFISCGFALGGALGPWLTGHIFDTSQNYRTAFIICAIISIINIVLAIILRSPWQNDKHQPPSSLT